MYAYIYIYVYIYIYIFICIYIYIYVIVSSNPFRHAEIDHLHESVRSQWAILAALPDVADFSVKSQLQLVLRQALLPTPKPPGTGDFQMMKTLPCQATNWGLPCPMPRGMGMGRGTWCPLCQGEGQANSPVHLPNLPSLPRM